MKKLNRVAAAMALGAFAACASAATATDDFTVTINFTGGCTVKTAASDMSFTYVAFDTQKTGNATTVFKCSRGLTPTFTLNDNGGTMIGSSAIAVGSTMTGEGVIAGIRYTLAGAVTKSQAGTAAVAGTGTAGTDGTPDEYTVSLDAVLATGQAGSGLSGSGVHTRVVTITY